MKNTQEKFTYVNACDKFTGDNNCKYGPFYMMLENPDTKKYILVSYWDKLADIVHHHQSTGFNLENCVEIITSAGTHESDIIYNSLGYLYTPFSYITTTQNNEETIERLYTTNTKRTYPKKPTFRGYLYNFRKYLEEDNRFSIKDKTIEYLTFPEYLSELNNSHLNLSLNGAGEICHRDIEILGLGTALFRFKLITTFHDPLIPDYHYISIPHEDLVLDNIDIYFKQLSDRILERFHQVKKDKEYIQFVACNGRDWYLKNGTIAANANILNQIINLNKLRR
jgi:hypothetical protein